MKTSKRMVALDNAIASDNKAKVRKIVGDAFLDPMDFPVFKPEGETIRGEKNVKNDKFIENDNLSKSK